MIALYQDAAKAFPVTGSGDPVGAIVLTGGTITEFAQTTAANRPIYRTDGTYGWLEFNGLSQWLEASHAQLAYPYTMAVAAEASNPGQNGAVLSLFGVDAGHQILSRPGNLWTLGTWNRSQQYEELFVSAVAGSPHVLLGQATSVELRVSVDGGADSTEPNATPHGTVTKLILGQRGDDKNFYFGRIFGAVFINRLLTEGEKGDVRAKLASASGATLI